MSEVMTRCFPSLARPRQGFLLIAATMVNTGAASVQAPFYPEKVVEQTAEMAARMKKILGD